MFKAEDNGDGTWTYWGVATDFAITGRGRNAVEVWKATLPAPPESPAGKGKGGGGKGGGGGKPPR